MAARSSRASQSARPPAGAVAMLSCRKSDPDASVRRSGTCWSRSLDLSTSTSVWTWPLVHYADTVACVTISASAAAPHRQPTDVASDCRRRGRDDRRRVQRRRLQDAGRRAAVHRAGAALLGGGADPAAGRPLRCGVRIPRPAAGNGCGSAASRRPVWCCSTWRWCAVLSHAEPAVIAVAVACAPVLISVLGPLLEGRRPDPAAAGRGRGGDRGQRAGRRRRPGRPGRGGLGGGRAALRGRLHPVGAAGVGSAGAVGRVRACGVDRRTRC